MSKLSPWLVGARIHTLSAGLVPVLVGNGLAHAAGRFSWPLFWLILAGALLVQVGANYTDEYADHDAVASQGKYPAPHKVIARGLLTPAQVRRGALAVFGLATLIGGYLVWRTGWLLLALCLLSLAAAWAYSAGPAPLGDYALGEGLVFLFMGPVMVGGAYYVQTGGLSRLALGLSVAVGALVTAILVANNLRDLEEDRGHGRHTLATRLGAGPVKLLYAALVALAYATAAHFAFWQDAPWLYLPFLALPLGAVLVARVFKGGSHDQRHATLKKTSAHHLLFGLLLALATVLR